MSLLTSIRRIRNSSWNWIFVLCALTSCQVDSRYNFENLQDLDLTVTLFEKGIEVPVGRTERISVAQLTSLAGDGLDSILSEGADGSYTLSYSDSLDLSDQLASVDFSVVSSLDGIRIDRYQTYDMGIDRSRMTIGGMKWTRTYPVGPIEIELDLPAPDVSEDLLAHIELELDSLAVEIEQSKEIAYDVTAMSSLGDCCVVPDDQPSISVKLSLPHSDKIVYKTGEDGITFVLPSWIVITDPAGIKPASTFGSKTNTITYKGIVPELFSIPVGYFIIKPDEDGKVDGELVVKGEVVTEQTVMEYAEIKDLSNSEVSVVVEMPDMVAKEVMLEKDFVIDMDESFEFTMFEASSIPSELDYLSEVGLEDTWLDCTIEAEGLPTVASGVFDVDLKVELPAYLSPSSFNVKGRLDADGKLSIEPVKILKINNIDLSKKEDIIGNVHITGTIVTPKPTIELADISNNIKATIHASIGNKDGKICVGNIVSRCSYDIAYNESVKFDNIPDLLKSPETCLDIVNPELELVLSGNTSIPMSGSLDITPWYDGRKGESISLPEIVLPCSSDISVMETKRYTVGGEALAGLFRQIPDSLQISVRGGVDGERDCIIDPTAEYKLTLAYSLSLPLEIGGDFSISVSDTLEVGTEITDVMKMATIGLKCDVQNTIPLGMEMSLQFLDYRGQEIIVSEDEVAAVVSAGRGCGQAPIETPFTAVIKPVEDADIDSIAAIRITYRLKANELGGVLNSADYVEAALSAILPEGITFDLGNM